MQSDLLSPYFSEAELSDINLCNDEGKNLLHRALENDDIPAGTVRELIKLGVDINQPTGPDRSGDVHLEAMKELDIEIPPEMTQYSEMMGKSFHTPLHFACRSGMNEKLRILLESGADVSATSSSNYSCFLDATYGALSLPFDEAKERFELLINYGADMEVASDYKETPLTTAVRQENWKLAGLLLELGANPGPLQWNALFHALAFGDAGEVRAAAQSDSGFLKTCDFRGVSPLFFAASTGDLEKVKVVVELGADLHETGRFGQNILFSAINSNSESLCQWLIEQGVRIDQKDEFDHRPIHHAVEIGADRCISILVEAGADIFEKDKYDFGLFWAADSLPVAKALLAAGLDGGEMPRELRHQYVNLQKTDTIECSKKEFLKDRTRHFGKQNPEVMDRPFWREMVRTGESGYFASSKFGDSSFEKGEPVWCFSRFGHSFTELEDGRVFEIGGEHEDSYDPDFCIYNDVVVHQGDGRFTIYGYPESVFSPTDFHSATLVGSSIYLIGCLGYPHQRQPGVTPVYQLDTESLRIERIETGGEAPGWISKHRATLISADTIQIDEGTLYDPACETEDSFPTNRYSYQLDLNSRQWTRL